VLEGFDTRGRAAWIAERLGLTQAAAEAALYQDVEEESAFIRVSAALQRLAAELARH